MLDCERKGRDQMAHFFNQREKCPHYQLMPLQVMQAGITYNRCKKCHQLIKAIIYLPR